jgi:hypothetical protein
MYYFQKDKRAKEIIWKSGFRNWELNVCSKAQFDIVSDLLRLKLIAN